MRRLIDLTGKVFGRLTVLERTSNSRHAEAWWLCLCECGNNTEVVSQRLREGITKSCGCLQKEGARKRIKILHKKAIRPEAAFNSVLSNYKVHARRRNIIFDLSREEFRNLVTQPCYYCGASPSNTSISDSGIIFKYNGVDRLVSADGYQISNCVPCCRPCNWMKKDTSVDDFLKQIKNIYKHQQENMHG